MWLVATVLNNTGLVGETDIEAGDSNKADGPGWGERVIQCAI